MKPTVPEMISRKGSAILERRLAQKLELYERLCLVENPDRSRLFIAEIPGVRSFREALGAEIERIYMRLHRQHLRRGADG